MQTVSLCYELRLRLAGENVHARCDLRYIPGDERNLAVRAAMRYLEELGEAGQGVQIEIVKRIPVGAGMGVPVGADAAAVVRR